MFRAAPLPRTLEAALRDLHSARSTERASAVRDLVPHAGDARDAVVTALKVRLRQDTAAEVRAAAASALADVRAVEALPDLLFGVEDDDARVREMAISALGELGDARAQVRLERALSDARVEVRFQAVMAFPRVTRSSEAALTALLQASRDRDPLVAHIALRMTEELAGASGPEPRVLARARELLEHASPDVRVIAALILADGEDPTLRAIVKRAVTGEAAPRDPEDLAAVIELAGSLGIEEARAGLERRAFGGLFGFRRDPFAWHARVALARMGHARACREIVGELTSRDRDVRSLAVAAAGRARLESARSQLLALRGDAERADPSSVEEALAALAASDGGTKIRRQP